MGVVLGSFALLACGDSTPDCKTVARHMGEVEKAWRGPEGHHLVSESRLEFYVKVCEEKLEPEHRRCFLEAKTMEAFGACHPSGAAYKTKR